MMTDRRSNNKKSKTYYHERINTTVGETLPKILDVFKQADRHFYTKEEITNKLEDIKVKSGLYEGNIVPQKVRDNIDWHIDALFKLYEFYNIVKANGNFVYEKNGKQYE